MEVNFNLRDVRATAPTPVNIVIRYSGHRIVYPSLEKVHPANWNAKKQRAKELASFPEHRELNSRLATMEERVRTTFRKYLNDHNETTPSPSIFKDLLDAAFKRMPKTDAEELNLLEWKKTGDKARPYSYRGFLSKHINELSARHNDRTGQPIAKNTIRNYNSFRECLREFAEATGKRKTKIEFSEITLDYYFDFVNYLTNERELSPNSIGTHVKNLKATIRSAEERGITVNPAYKSRRFVTVETTTHAVYLTKAEVEELANLDLREDPRLKRARDLFLIGCRTGLRYSDFVKLKAEDFETGKIRIRTQKTKDVLFIPIHADVNRIRSEYSTENQLPELISNQKLNEALKDVCQLIPSLRKSISITVTKAGKEVTVKVPKWQQVSSHTARRTFATNCYLDKIPTRTIMRITGHKKEDDFFRYIRMTPEDDAKILEMHFNTETSALKVV